MTRATIEIPEGCEAIALGGGPYSNFGAVDAFLAATAHLRHRFCLGDLGGFGPHPDRTLERIRASELICLQGNYDHAVGFDERDCGCGYLDPRDRETAQISFAYTASNTSAHYKVWLRELPEQILVTWRGARILLVHGSPDRVNEFVWESETDDARIDAWLARENVDAICGTHSGIPWVRTTRRGFWCNVGVIGRPAHDGTPRVGYAVLNFPAGTTEPKPELVPLDYDPAPVAAAMRAEGLPEEFAASLECGRWTTSHNILPPAERVIANRYQPHARRGAFNRSILHARDAAPAQGD